MTVKSPPPPRKDVHPVASSALTKDRPSGSWLLANNPTLAFSSFLSSSSGDRPVLSATRPTPVNSSYTKTVTNKSSSTSQRTPRKSATTVQKQPPQQKPEHSVSFDTDFPTLTNVSSPLTPTTADPPSSTSTTTTTTTSHHHHAWSNAQRIQYKVKSPAKASWHGEGSDNEEDDNMMEIQRLKALVPRRHSHHQGATANTSSSSAASASGIHRQRILSTTTPRVMTTTRKRPPPSRLWAPADRKTSASTPTTLRLDDDSLSSISTSSSSSSSSSCSSILSPPPPLSPITSNTSTTTTTEPTSTSTPMNDVVTKREQLRFYLFLKKWTGHLVGDSKDPSDWQQKQQHIISRPLPIGTERHDSYDTTPLYG